MLKRTLLCCAIIGLLGVGCADMFRNPFQTRSWPAPEEDGIASVEEGGATVRVYDEELAHVADTAVSACEELGYLVRKVEHASGSGSIKALQDDGDTVWIDLTGADGSVRTAIKVDVPNQPRQALFIHRVIAARL
jgi:hypothetical protein